MRWSIFTSASLLLRTASNDFQCSMKSPSTPIILFCQLYHIKAHHSNMLTLVTRINLHLCAKFYYFEQCTIKCMDCIIIKSAAAAVTNHFLLKVLHFYPNELHAQFPSVRFQKSSTKEMYRESRPKK